MAAHLGSFKWPLHKVDILVHGYIYDDSTTDIFEDNEPLGSGSGATHSLSVIPSWASAFLLQKISYMMNPTAAETYTLHLLEASEDLAADENRRLIYSSTAGQADTIYYKHLRTDNALPVPVKLTDPGTLYFKLDWTGAPGNTTGYIAIRGTLLSRI